MLILEVTSKSGNNNVVEFTDIGNGVLLDHRATDEFENPVSLYENQGQDGIATRARFASRQLKEGHFHPLDIISCHR